MTDEAFMPGARPNTFILHPSCFILSSLAHRSSQRPYPSGERDLSRLSGSRAKEYLQSRELGEKGAWDRILHPSALSRAAPGTLDARANGLATHDSARSPARSSACAGVTARHRRGGSGFGG